MLNGISMRLVLLLCAATIGATAFAGCGSKNEQPTVAGSGGEDNTQVTASRGATVEAQDPSDSNNDTNRISKEPPPVQILAGATTGYFVNKPAVLIVQSTKARNSMLKRHFSHGVKRQQVSGTQFAERQLVGLFLPKGPKGSLVVINDVHQEGDSVVVSAVEVLVASGCETRGPALRPFHIVETRRMTSKQQPLLKLRKQRASEC